MVMHDILNRVYSDFLMPCRLNEYRDIQKLAISRQYEMHSVKSFWGMVAKGINRDKKYFINRHDIDTDLNTARKMFEIDRSNGVVSSFYFRLHNYDVEFMSAIEQSGFEASYHYEELSSYAKKHHIKDGKLVLNDLFEIRKAFKNNINELRKKTGLPMKTVAAHGDFANRKFGITNSVILSDIEFRRSSGIILEAYDDEFMKHVTGRYSDAPYPEYYQPCSPRDAILRGEKVIYFLTHPRHWQINIYENLKDNIIRFYEGATY